MKCLLLADNRPDLLATLEPILKHWGYRVVATGKADQASAFIQESRPCMVIIGEQLITAQNMDLEDSILRQIQARKLPLVVLRQEGAGELPVEPGALLEVPVDIFALFSFIQKYVEKHPRQNLRLRLHLPGMYRHGDDNYMLADVLSLSTQGLFFKSAKRLNKGDLVTVVFPLLGHCRELEIQSTVLYVIEPGPTNNFMQGFGVGFGDLGEDERQSLQNYIEEHFLNEVSTCQGGVGEFSAGQLKR